jgi:uncharacterized protein YcbX
VPPHAGNVALVSVVGVVEQVSVYPVKSLGGRTVPEAQVGPAGLVGDRAWFVVDATTGERVTVKTTPAMAEIVATGDDEADTITLTEVLGRPVRLQRTATSQDMPPKGSPPKDSPPKDSPPKDMAPQVDAAAVHLVSRTAVRRAADGDVPEGCSAGDPRANVVLDLRDGEDERGWVGRGLRIGEVELRVTRTPKHCLGVYAEVHTPGRVRVGDRVELLH